MFRYSPVVNKFISSRINVKAGSLGGLQHIQTACNDGQVSTGQIFSFIL